APDACLLDHRAPHGPLEALARLAEAGEHAVERPVEPGAPGEQHAVAALDEHDHRRRDPRVVRGAARWAEPGELRPGGFGACAAAAAVRVTELPLDQLGAAACRRRELLVRDREEVPQLDERRAFELRRRVERDGDAERSYG